jgi:hypothetical protein
MGILDEAIREHLELKRKHGAPEDDLRRLEDEAFGPPSRPGEPDFPEAGLAVAEVEPDFEIEPEPAEAEAPAEEATEATEVEQPQPADEPADDFDLGDLDSLDEPATEAPASEAETTFFDQSDDSGLELDELDLGLEEETPPAAKDPAISFDEPGIEPTPAEPGVTEEHIFEDEVTDEGASADEEESAEGDDDVLADTPDFLRDTPEDDELWFEQGEPKDFDFDDEEK